MVGEVTEANAHPFVDRSGTRAVCENGSHNASRLLTLRRQQENWWRGRGLSEGEPVHRSENTTEVLVYEWERTVHRILEDKIDAEEGGFIDQLVEWGVADVEEQALRLTLRRVRPGTAHACVFYSRLHPGVLYVSSHHKPIAIITRKHTTGQEIMVASDINAALMLWPGDQVDAAAERIEDLQKAVSSGKARKEEAQQEIQSILEQFNAEVIFLDQDLYGGEELLARIESRVDDGEIQPAVRITRYDGTPVAVRPRQMQLNPTVVGKQGYPTYTEFHIAEIPDVLDNLVLEYVRDGEIDLASTWLDENIYSPGLNLNALTERFGPYLERLERLMLVGEGSSWRDAQAAAPLFRELLPEVLTVIYRPAEVLNLGKVADPATTLVVEISWSGTTDSVLKADSWFAGAEVLRLGITGRPQSDLGRRTASSAGTLDVHSGVEVSVATVKGFEAILMTLNLAALSLSRLHRHGASLAELANLQDELTLSVPRHVRAVVEDELRRERIHEVGRRCRDFNKVAVVGDSPIIIEGELKIEELAQIVACPFDFHMPSLRSLIERSAMVAEDRHRTLFIINATSPKAQRETRPVLNYLMTLGAYCIVHTTPGEYSAAWQNSPTVEIFHSPQVTDRLQPLIDALFFFDFAVAMAYGRGLTPKKIDRPRNLAKSVTTTGAEKRADVEARREFANITLTEFGQKSPELATSAAMKPSVSMRQALAVLTEPLPDRLSLAADRSLVIVTDSEAIENAANMARGAWVELFGVDMTVFRQFLTDSGRLHDGTNRLRLVRAGAILSVLNAETIAFPEDMSPLQLELLGTVYLTGLAVRLARQRGENMEAWEAGIARLPRIVSEVLNGGEFAKRVRRILRPFVQKGYDKVQVIGGGQDFTAGASIARSLRERGFMAEALHTDSAWHGPLATVGGPDAEHDTLIVILATDPLFQPAAMVDTQVYRTRRAPVILVVPEGSQNLDAVRGVNASAVLTVPLLPRAFVPVANAALGAVLAREMDILWSERQEDIFPLEE
jgi:glucosamine 6-phosphate synthetase-like amidotransferase/phosphosugar isomerase protein